MSRALFTLILAGLLAGVILTGCARRQGPPGGPRDTTPPDVLSFSPSDGSVNVRRDSTITILFSEKLDQRSLDQALWIEPTYLVPRIKMESKQATITMRELLPEDATVSVLISSRLADRKENRLAAPVQWTFSTGPTLAQGRISGKLEGR